MGVVLAFTVVFASVVLAAQAATVEGIVYSADLQPIAAVVSVDTQPRQTLVAANGSYSLQLPQGEFELTAVSAENASLSAREKVRIGGGEGTYAIDFILLGEDAGELADALRELEEVAGLEDESLPLEETGGINFAAVIAAFVLLAAIAFAYSRLKQGRDEKKKAEAREQVEAGEQKQAPQSFSHDEKEVLAKLSAAGGLLSQKDLRKALPFWSEARASLVVSALEKQGLLKSFKQGRGNILKLLE